MPDIRITTNIAKKLFDASFMRNLTSRMAALTGKPENVVVISVSADEVIHMADSFDTAANVTLSTIGQCNEVNNQKYTEVIFEALNGIGVSSDRIHVVFRNVTPDNVAWKNKLLSQVQAGK